MKAIEKVEIRLQKDANQKDIYRKRSRRKKFDVTSPAYKKEFITSIQAIDSVTVLPVQEFSSCVTAIIAVEMRKTRHFS